MRTTVEPPAWYQDAKNRVQKALATLETTQIQRFGLRESASKSFHVSNVMLQSGNETYLPLTSCTSNYPAIDGGSEVSEAPCAQERTRPNDGNDKLQRQRRRWFSEELFDLKSRQQCTPPAAPAAGTGKISQQAAVLAALGWAPGFYGSTGTAATSVDFLSDADVLLSRAPDGQGRRLHSTSLRGRPG